MSKNKDERYDRKEAQSRFVAALRGAFKNAPHNPKSRTKKKPRHRPKNPK